MCEQTGDTDRVLYLFCFANAGAQPDLAGQDQLVAYRWGELIAVCGWTGVQEWSGPQTEQRMQDLDWLAPKAIRHQAVIEAAMRLSPVLPARLGTLFSSPHALERFFAIHHATIASFLAEVEGKEEWAVKGVLDRGRASEWLASTMNEAPQVCAPSGGGASYLHKRRAQGAAAREVNRWAARMLEPIVDELHGYAADSCQRSPGTQVAAGQAQAILNVAFLVARENLAGFRRCVERAAQEHQGHGLELALSGPWPPYSFCPTLEMPP
jgi:gas vesicle protein GvpL/GvpF